MTLPLLETDRLLLRPIEPNDLDGLHRLLVQPEVRRYLCDDQIFSRDEVGDRLQAAIDSSEHGLGMWLLVGRAEQQVLGFTALRTIEGTGEVELFYALTPEVWGQGLASEASRAVFTYGFESLGLPRIWARTDEPNIASIAVMCRLGMQPASDPGESSFVSYVLECPYRKASV